MWLPPTVGPAGHSVQDLTSLSLVIGALGLALPLLRVIGLLGLVVGVIPAAAYLLLVNAHIIGEYAPATEPHEVREEGRLVPAGIA
jgi:hypothetical protein